MIEHLFEGQALLFTVPALLGSALFMLRVGMMFPGGVADAELDVHAGDAPGHAFTFLSVQGIASFLIGFGFGGLVGLHTLEWSSAASTVVGIGFGALLFWLLGMLLRAVLELRSSGHVAPEDAAGCRGTVDAFVPEHAGGAGQVRVVVGDRERSFNATSIDEALPTGTSIRVVYVNEDRSLMVTRI